MDTSVKRCLCRYCLKLVEVDKGTRHRPDLPQFLNIEDPHPRYTLNPPLWVEKDVSLYIKTRS